MMVFPRAFLVKNAVIANSEEEAILRTRNLGWGTRDTLVLEGASSEQLAQISVSKENSVLGSAEVELYSQSEVAIRVDASEASFVVLTDILYPGWRAYIDGKPETIYRAYGIVRAVFVAAGPHEVLFRYEPDSFRLGSTVTAVSALMIALLYVIEMFLTSRKKGESTLR